ncbi:hypothetical protein [Adhaeribacter pallidiroseus]|uniref:Uncharacterized protein n=1 Tax=Adhaeribacter pallidiroseus TaxID=2072847 RepID=A0A369QCY2_9BACT|nr:hypothetical protein [Adhaeribacter pallidiroseus]RDC61425.1 hypothetical protein AHMF7616_00004 [Adhaeribacter pallidiroseus]
MKAITSLYSNALVSESNFRSSSDKLRTYPAAAANVISVLMTTPAKPKITVLKNSHLVELQKLTKSLRAQVRNSVALIKFLHAKKVDYTGIETEPASKQNAFGESLTFRFSTDPEAFYLFADTLLRKSYFLHHHAEVDPDNQLLKVRVAESRLPELEQELSIVFENIKPINYLETYLLRK